MSRCLRLGLCGLGTVGSALYREITQNSDMLAEAAGCSLQIAGYSARSERSDMPEPYFENPVDLVRSDQIDVVIELIGGVDVAGQVARAALDMGKPLVTANKALIAEYGSELLKSPARIGFEAAIAGGIPVVKALNESLRGNRIKKISCILNGTSNFILSSMHRDGEEFDEVLLRAQQQGYAEADPTLDVSGGDAAHKLCILAALAYGIAPPIDSLTPEGITDISSRDCEFAKMLGYRIRPLGIAEWVGEQLDIRVHAALVSEQHVLAQVDGVMNAVHIHADPVGVLFLHGPGAGAGATASAVLGDILDIARGGDYPLSFADRRAEVMDPGTRESVFYLRMDVQDRPGMVAAITQLLASQCISIQELMQHSEWGVDGTVPLVVLTNRVTETQLHSFLQAFQELSDTCKQVCWLRVMGDE